MQFREICELATGDQSGYQIANRQSKGGGPAVLLRQEIYGFITAALYTDYIDALQKFFQRKEILAGQGLHTMKP